VIYLKSFSDVFKTLLTEPPERYSNSVEVIKKLAELLKQHEDFKNVVPITAAKVPIVKFEYLFRGKLYEGDISYYNVLAQRNTQLLSLYATLDSRCQKLGYVLKGRFIAFLQKNILKLLK
jgi:terminal uridylyltransferase